MSQPDTLTSAIEVSIAAHPPIPEPEMPPYAGHTFTVEAPVDDMPRVIAELTVALAPHADAIDRAQIAALGGYPADLCGVWERSKL